MNQHCIGEGRLTWNGVERRSDRYGSIYLIEEGHDSTTPEPSRSLIDQEKVAEFKGRRGSLVATVTEARDSTHIGDLFRGIYPSRPEVGEVIELGTGILFADELEYAPGICVGLKPDDGRDSDWLDPRKLYRAHEQSVKLYFRPLSQ